MSVDGISKADAESPMEPAVDSDRRAKLARVAEGVKELLCSEFEVFTGKNITIVPHLRQGWQNAAFTVFCDGKASHFFRVSFQERNWANFYKESFCLQQVKDVLPVPALSFEKPIIFEVDGQECCGLLTEHVFGTEAFVARKQIDSEAFTKKLGLAAKKISSIPCKGFGQTFDAKTNCFTLASWADYVAQMQERCGLAHLERFEMVQAEQAAIFRERMSKLAEQEVEARLFHHDFIQNWRNIMIHPTSHEVQAIIDWEFAGAGAAIEMELASCQYVLHRDGRAEEEKTQMLQWTLEGMGISHEQYKEEFEESVDTLVMSMSFQGLYKYVRLLMDKKLLDAPWRAHQACRAQAYVSSACEKSKAVA